VDVSKTVEIAVTVLAEAGVQVQVQTGVGVGARADVGVVGVKGDEDSQVIALELDPRPGQKIVSLVRCSGSAPCVTMTMTGVV
jgi:hypothetical protein